MLVYQRVWLWTLWTLIWSGWWFGTMEFYCSFHIWVVILPIDELHHFSRWWNCTTKQIYIYIYKYFIASYSKFFENWTYIGDPRNYCRQFHTSNIAKKCCVPALTVQFCSCGFYLLKNWFVAMLCSCCMMYAVCRHLHTRTHTHVHLDAGCWTYHCSQNGIEGNFTGHLDTWG